MNILNTIKNLFVVTPQATVEPKVIEQYIPKPEPLFACHHCGHQFEVTSQMIFPTSVRLLYKDQYITGKGVTCPKCFKDSIFG